jgi:hypothetical protein
MPTPPYAFFSLDPTYNNLRTDAESEILISPIKKSLIPKVLAVGEPIETAILDENAVEALHNFGMPEACQKYADAAISSLVRY